MPGAHTPPPFLWIQLHAAGHRLAPPAMALQHVLESRAAPLLPRVGQTEPHRLTPSTPFAADIL